MKIVFADTKMHLLRLDRGEELLSSLAKYCQKKHIHAGFFTALGACEKVTVAYYDLEEKKYLDRTTSKDLEIIGITGNVSQMNRKYVIHAHGSFAGQNYNVFGGHIKELLVSATCEVHLSILKGSLQRKFDKNTGLNLLKKEKRS